MQHVDFNSIAPRTATPSPWSRVGLTDLLPILTRRWKLAAGVAAATLAVAIAATVVLPERYTAKAQITIDSRSGQLVGATDLMAGASMMVTEIETQAAVATSQRVLADTIARLELWKLPEFAVTPSLTDRVMAALGIGASTPVDYTAVSSFTELPPQVRSALVETLAKKVSSRREGLTSVVSVQAVSKDPAVAAMIANALTASYLDGQIDSSVETAQRAASFLEDRVAILAQKVETDERAIDDFLQTQTMAAGSPETRQQMERLRGELTDISERQATMETRLASYRQYLAGGSVSLLNGETDGDLAQTIADRQAVAAAVTAGTDTTVADLEALDTRLQADVDRRSIELSSQIDGLSARSQDIRRTFETVVGTQAVSSDVASQLFRLNKELETSRGLYASYVQRLEEARQQATLTLPNSRVVSEAIVPTSPSFPPRSLFLFAGLVLAAGAGLGTAVLRESLVGGFVNDEQFELVAGREVMGVVPETRTPGMKPYEEIVDNSFSPFAEAVRRIRATIAMRRKDTGGIGLLVTSSEPGEGKSTLSMSIARAFALTGFRTVILDADLRRPTLSGMVGSAANDGMIEFFSSGAGAQDVPSRRVELAEGVGFDFIGGGSGQMVATDALVGSDRFAALVADLKTRYDVVILDTPPINHVVDAKVMAPLVDTCVYVVRQGGPSQRSVLSGLRAMAHAMAGRSIMPVLYGVKGARAKQYGGYYTNAPVARG